MLPPSPPRPTLSLSLSLLILLSYPPFFSLFPRAFILPRVRLTQRFLAGEISLPLIHPLLHFLVLPPYFLLTQLGPSNAGPRRGFTWLPRHMYNICTGGLHYLSFPRVSNLPTYIPFPSSRSRLIRLTSALPYYLLHCRFFDIVSRSLNKFLHPTQSGSEWYIGRYTYVIWMYEAFAYGTAPPLQIDNSLIYVHRIESWLFVFVKQIFMPLIRLMITNHFQRNNLSRCISHP